MRTSLFLLVSLAFLVPAPLSAQTTWTGSVSDDLCDAANWMGAIDDLDVRLDVARFGSSPLPTRCSVPQTVGFMRFSDSVVLSGPAAMVPAPVGHSSSIDADVSVTLDGYVLSGVWTIYPGATLTFLTGTAADEPDLVMQDATLRPAVTSALRIAMYGDSTLEMELGGASDDLLTVRGRMSLDSITLRIVGGPLPLRRYRIATAGPMDALIGTVILPDGTYAPSEWRIETTETTMDLVPPDVDAATVDASSSAEDAGTVDADAGAEDADAALDAGVEAASCGCHAGSPRRAPWAWLLLLAVIVRRAAERGRRQLS